MNRIELLRKGAVNYANNHNSVPVIRAFITKFHRDDVGFSIHSHVSGFKSSGHSTGCGCPYCITLYRYAREKILLHRLNKNLDFEFEIGPLASHNHSLINIRNKEKECKRLREKLVQLAENLEIPNSVKRKVPA